MSRSCFLLIDLYIPLEAPLSDFFERFPRFAASAAPAAICCFFDRAGIQMFRWWKRKRICLVRGAFAPEKINRQTGEHDRDSNSGGGRREPGKIDNQQSGALVDLKATIKRAAL